jgi:hypothetical protein
MEGRALSRPCIATERTTRRSSLHSGIGCDGAEVNICAIPVEFVDRREAAEAIKSRTKSDPVTEGNKGNEGLYERLVLFILFVVFCLIPRDRRWLRAGEKLLMEVRALSRPCIATERTTRRSSLHLGIGRGAEVNIFAIPGKFVDRRFLLKRQSRGCAFGGVAGGVNDASGAPKP